MPVAQHPLHRSVRAALQHTAPASGHDDRTSRKQPFVSASGRLSHEPGSKPGARCQPTDFPWPAAFPPPPPRPGHRRPGVVRQLPRYYAAIRLPAPVAHRRVPPGFTMRAAANVSRRTAVGRGTFRFPCEMFPRVRGVCDRPGSAALLPSGSLPRLHRCGLRCVSTTSAPRSPQDRSPGPWITRLNTRPARTPVNASPTPSRMCTHDSGPPYVAKPSTYDSFIHNTSPASTGAPETA